MMVKTLEEVFCEEIYDARGHTVRWLEIEECLDSIALDVQHRCYPEPGTSGVRHLLMVVRRHLLQIDRLLLEDHA